MKYKAQADVWPVKVAALEDLECGVCAWPICRGEDSWEHHDLDGECGSEAYCSRAHALQGLRRIYHQAGLRTVNHRPGIREPWLCDGAGTAPQTVWTVPTAGGGWRDAGTCALCGRSVDIEDSF